MHKLEDGMLKLNCEIYNGAAYRAMKTEPETH